jgi:hypothetical protein
MLVIRSSCLDPLSTIGDYRNYHRPCKCFFSQKSAPFAARNPQHSGFLIILVAEGGSGIIEVMIRRIVEVRRLDGYSEIRQNLQYWLSRPGEERLAAVDSLRHQIHGHSERLQRTARVIQRPQG